MTLERGSVTHNATSLGASRILKWPKAALDHLAFVIFDDKAGLAKLEFCPAPQKPAPAKKVP